MGSAPKRKADELAPVAEGPVSATVESNGGEGEFELSKLDKAKAKKRRKEEQRALENPPSFSFDTRGFKGGRTIKLSDVRDFVLHLLADEKAQQWLFVTNKRNLRRVVCVMIPGILPPALGLATPPLSANLPFALTPAPDSTSSLPIFQKLFSHACPTKAPGEKNRMHSCYQTFTTTPLSGAEKDRREKARKELGQKAAGTDPTPYLLSREQMIEQTYPECSPRPAQPLENPTFDDWRKENGWVEAPYTEAAEGEKAVVLGIDCEMCLTEDGSELTRVSVVDQKGNQIYDCLVKPDKPILDYLTRYSGITEEKLANVTTKLVDVQRELSKLINFQTILIGHSLECDLRVLKLAHSRVIDTSVMYQHPRGPPFKASLKWLAQKWLKKEIQNQHATPNHVGGHDSFEDAATCIELLALKLLKGPGFGEFVQDQETIFERIARGQDKKSSAVVDHGTPSQWHGAKAETAIGCANDEEVLAGMMESAPTHDLTMGRFMELSHALGWSQPPSAATLAKGTGAPPGHGVAPAPDAVPDSSTEAPLAEAAAPVDLATVYSSLNSRLSALHASLPPLSALIVFTGHGDPQAMSRLTAKKAKFDRLWKTMKQSEIPSEDRWMESDDRQLLEEVDKCRSGLSFFCIK